MRMNDLTKNLLLWVVVAVVLMVVFQTFSPKLGTGAGESQPNYSQFLQEVNDGRVTQVRFTKDGNLTTNALEYKRSDGTTGTVYGPTDQKLVDQLVRKNVAITPDAAECGVRRRGFASGAPRPTSHRSLRPRCASRSASRCA